MTALLSFPLDELLGVALAEAEGDVGDAAPAMLLKAYREAASRDSDGYLPSAILLHLTHHRHPRKVVDALVQAGALRRQGKGYQLVRYLEANPSRALKEQQRAAERDRKRKGAAPSPAPQTAPEPPPDAHPDSGADSGTDSRADGGADSGPGSGRPSQTLPSQGESNFRGNPPGSSPVREGSSPRPSTPEAHPDARAEAHPDAHPSRPDSSPASTPPAGSGGPAGAEARRPGPHAAAVLPGLDVTMPQLAQAYAAGISKATGRPCSPPSEAWNLKALRTAAQLHAERRSGAALLAWVTQSATGYFTTCKDVAAHSSKNFSAEKWREWLDAGSPLAPPASSARVARTAPLQPAVPAAPSGSRWKPGIDLQTFAAEEAAREAAEASRVAGGSL